MDAEKLEQDEIKSLVQKVITNIDKDDAPEELVRIYESMEPEHFGFWLHGFACGQSKNKTLRASEFYRYLKEQLLPN